MSASRTQLVKGRSDQTVPLFQEYATFFPIKPTVLETVDTGLTVMIWKYLPNDPSSNHTLTDAICHIIHPETYNHKK